MKFKQLRRNIRVILKQIVGNIITHYNKNRKKPTKINVFLESIYFFLSNNSWPDFRKPKTFSEYIGHMKFYGDLEKMANVSDKIKVMEKVKKEVGEKYLLKTYDILDKFDDVDKSKYEFYPKPFVAKPNNASNRIFINTNNDFKLFKNSVKSFFEEYGNYAQELHYKLIPPKLLVQEFINPSDDQVYDFKFYVFNGRVELILVHPNLLENKSMGVYKAMFYTREWEKSDIQRRYINENTIDRPKCLSEMINVAETLSKGWMFMRIDMYLYDNIIKFGEMTPMPLGGRGSFTSASADKLLYDRYLGPKTPIT